MLPAISMLKSGLEHVIILDGYPLGLGLAVEDKLNEFSFTSTSTTKSDLSIRTS